MINELFEQKGDGPQKELLEACKCFTQFLSAKEFVQLINNVCGQKELKV